MQHYLTGTLVNIHSCIGVQTLHCANEIHIAVLFLPSI